MSKAKHFVSAYTMANRTCSSIFTLRSTFNCAIGTRCLHTTSSKSALINTYVPPETIRTVPTTNTITTKPSPLARLPTSHILRSLLLSAFFTTPLLFKPGFAIFHGIAKSRSRILNPDNNPLLRSLIRPLVYDQFCAGKNAAEIDRTSALIKQLGFSGVVLCYSKEVQVDQGGKTYGYSGADSAIESEVKQWRDGTLETLEMTKEGDWIGIKITGAGLQVTNALCKGEAPPKVLADAMDAICQRAAEKNSRIWIDAEQQAVQPAIDQWTYDLMRKYNKDRAIVYNTVQAYLKAARVKVQKQLNTAAEEGWISAIKLVRGAYISNDQRSLIHDTKPETDESYNSIVTDVLRGQNFEVFEKHPNLKHAFLCAGHNIQTVRMASGLATELAAKGELKVVPEFAQLQGMADDVGCELLQVGEDAAKNASPNDTAVFIPKVYKCLTWGSIQECMQYLTRRLVENRGAADRMRIGAGELRKELGRRILMRN